MSCPRCDTGHGHHNGQGSGFGCRVKHVQIDPSTMPSRYQARPSKQFNNNSWERGIAVHKPSGMPYLDASLDTIPLHEWQSKRSTYERQFNAETAAPTETPV